MGIAVLGRGARADAVREDCFECVEIRASNILTLIYYKSGDLLAHTAAHDAGFAVVDGEPFFKGGDCDVRAESLGTLGEGLVAGEGEIVSITGVRRTAGFGKPEQAAIETISAKVGEGGRAGSTLWKVGLAIDQLRRPGSGCRPDIARGGSGAEATEKIGDGFGVTESAEETLDSLARNAWEEILQIHFEDNMPANVRSGEGLDRAAFLEAVDGRVRRNEFENAGKDCAL